MTVGLQTQTSGLQTGAPTPPVAKRVSIAICSDAADLLSQLSAAFESHQVGVESFVTSLAGVDDTLATNPCDALIVDAAAGGVQAETFEFLRGLAERHPDRGIVMAVETADLGATPALLQAGASGVMNRASGAETIASLAVLAASNARLARELRAAGKKLQKFDEPAELVGCSPAIRRLSAVVERAGENDATVLIEGKSGTGKTLLARLIHAQGRRASVAVIALDCSALDDEMLEAALRDADEGTLLLEDVDRMPTTCQSRLVKFLKDRNVRDVGRTDVRIVATTSARLAELTAKGSFREDLYYRLNMFPIVMPTLQERREDVPLLAAHFLIQSAERDGLPNHGFTAPAMIMLEAHPWPGNVRQLQNTVTRALALADGAPVDRIHLMGPTTGVHPPPGVPGLSDSISPQGAQDDSELTEDDILPFQEEEKRLLSRALRATKGNVRRSAQLLGIGRATLYRKIQIYQLKLQ